MCVRVCVWGGGRFCVIRHILNNRQYMGCFMFCSVYWDQTHFPQKGTKILLYVLRVSKQYVSAVCNRVNKISLTTAVV